MTAAAPQETPDQALRRHAGWFASSGFYAFLAWLNDRGAEEMLSLRPELDRLKAHAIRMDARKLGGAR